MYSGASPFQICAQGSVGLSRTSVQLARVVKPYLRCVFPDIFDNILDAVEFSVRRTECQLPTFPPVEKNLLRQKKPISLKIIN